LSACRHRRCGAIRMSPCRLRVHPARFPGLLGEHNPLLSPCRVLAVPCLHFSPAAAGLEFAGAAIPGQSPACRCRRLRFTRPHPSGPWPYYCVCRVATSASAFLPVVKKRGEKPCIQPPASRRVVPCLHFSPAAADASALTPPSSPGRRFFMMLAVLPVVFSLRFRSKTVQTSFALYLRCGLRCRPCIFRFSPGCRVGTAQPGAAVYVITEVYPCSM
jgi:hypothetical protein